MKFALFVATLAVASGVQLSKSGVDDESYDTHFDNLKNTITTTHRDAERTRTTDVNAQEASDKWRGVKDPSIFGVWECGFEQSQTNKYLSELKISLY